MIVLLSLLPLLLPTPTTTNQDERGRTYGRTTDGHDFVMVHEKFHICKPLYSCSGLAVMKKIYLHVLHVQRSRDWGKPLVLEAKIESKNSASKSPASWLLWTTLDF